MGSTSDWDCPLAVFEATLEHEQKVTGLINDLVYLAREEKDKQIDGIQFHQVNFVEALKVCSKWLNLNLLTTF
jgi:ferritin